MSEKLKCNSFGGKNSEQYNALMSALIEASGGKDTKDNDKVYSFLEETPKASLIVEVVDALNEIGYEIIKS
jgi:hypothetical protein